MKITNVYWLGFVNKLEKDLVNSISILGKDKMTFSNGSCISEEELDFINNLLFSTILLCHF